MRSAFPPLSLVLDRREIPADLISLDSALNGLAGFVIAPWLPRLVDRSARREAWRPARR